MANPHREPPRPSLEAAEHPEPVGPAEPIHDGAEDPTEGPTRAQLDAAVARYRQRRLAGVRELYAWNEGFSLVDPGPDVGPATREAASRAFCRAISVTIERMGRGRVGMAFWEDDDR